MKHTSDILVELAQWSEQLLTGGSWSEIFGVEIIDDDGWRAASVKWETPISLKQFCKFYVESTVRFLP
jgi:hypothetical protein